MLENYKRGSLIYIIVYVCNTFNLSGVDLDAAKTFSKQK